MKIIALFLSFLISQSVIGQKYSTEEIIKTAKEYLRKAVSEQTFNYFEYDTDTYYEYKTGSGKTKWKELNKQPKTKGDFVSVNVRFILDHPDYQHDWVTKSVNIYLDSTLNLANGIVTDQFPDFIINSKPSNWLTHAQLDSIIANQNLKTPVKPVFKRLEFNITTREHYWMVFNTLYEEKCFSNEELLLIDPVTGEIKDHREDRFSILHCY